jgi:transposase
MRAVLAISAYNVDETNTRLPFKRGELTERARIELAISMSGLSVNTVKRIINRFLLDGEIDLEDTSRRGAGAGSYARWEKVPDGAREALASFFEREVLNNKTPTWVTRHVVKEWFLENYDVSFSEFVVSRILKQWGYKYGSTRRAVGAKASSTATLSCGRPLARRPTPWVLFPGWTQLSLRVQRTTGCVHRCDMPSPRRSRPAHPTASPTASWTRARTASPSVTPSSTSTARATPLSTGALLTGRGAPTSPRGWSVFEFIEAMEV